MKFYGRHIPLWLNNSESFSAKFFFKKIYTWVLFVNAFIPDSMNSDISLISPMNELKNFFYHHLLFTFIKNSYFEGWHCSKYFAYFERLMTLDFNISTLKLIYHLR